MADGIDPAAIGWIIAGIVGGAAITFLALTFLGAQPPTPQVQAENAENWEWVDYKGNKRTLTVHREVKSFV